LHLEDRGLLNLIPMSDLVCLRCGEMAFDPRADSLQPLRHELLKVRGKGAGWECVYFLGQTKTCSIYGHRPAECRSLSCAETSGILQVMSTPTLSRADVVMHGSGLWDCIEEHESRFPVGRAMSLASAKEGGKFLISQELDRLIRLEMSFRQSLGEKVQARDQDLWAYLGRPLWLVLAPLSPAFASYESI